VLLNSQHYTIRAQATDQSDSDVPGIPSQIATASQFGVNAEGRMDLVPDPPIADDRSARFRRVDTH
jgi:hypothetical protein